MELTARSSVREVLRQCPGSRAVFERHGLAGCGGPEGPAESLALFARAHGVAPDLLLRDLREAMQGEPAPVSEPEPEVENYRYYLRAAVLVGALAGALLGAVNLTWIAAWGFSGTMPQWGWWPALIQSHGNAQLFGWTGLFIIGIACHSLPRMLRTPVPASGLMRAIFGLVLAGLLLVLVAQPLASRPPFAALFLLGAVLQWAGVSLFAATLLRAIRLPREPYLAFLALGTVWFWLGASARVALALVTARDGSLIPPAPLNAAYLHAMTWGFLLSFVLGYSLRLLPAFTGAAPPAPGPAWAAAGLLTLGTLAEVMARAWGSAPASLAAALLTAVGVAAALGSLRPWGANLTSGDADAAWLQRFSRTAYFWLAAAAVISLGLRAAEVLGPVSTLHQHAFGGAARHALTVGFVSLMMVGVAWRILPIFSGAGKPEPWLMPAVFGLLVIGNTLRVVGQIGAGLWGGPWYAVMGVSGWLETLALTFFALDVLRLLSGAPDRIAAAVATDPVEITIEAPVGPLVAGRPWLLPVFARHGMGQVSSPIFQRTVGQRVTLAQACGKFGIEPATFIAELDGAERGHWGPASPA